MASQTSKPPADPPFLASEILLPSAASKGQIHKSHIITVSCDWTRLSHWLYVSIPLHCHRWGVHTNAMSTTTCNYTCNCMWLNMFSWSSGLQRDKYWLNRIHRVSTLLWVPAVQRQVAGHRGGMELPLGLSWCHCWRGVHPSPARQMSMCQWHQSSISSCCLTSLLSSSHASCYLTLRRCHPLV